MYVQFLTSEAPGKGPLRCPGLSRPVHDLHRGGDHGVPLGCDGHAPRHHDLGPPTLRVGHTAMVQSAESHLRKCFDLIRVNILQVNTSLLERRPRLVKVCRSPGSTIEVVDVDMVSGHWAGHHDWTSVICFEFGCAYYISEKRF